MSTDSKDLLARSASLARKMAPQLCRKDPVSGEDCSWYHGLWQDLRLLGLAAAPEQQSAFLTNAFPRLPRKPLRLLISGAADYSILAHVLSACSEHKLTIAITIIDVCKTPLFSNQWYAEQIGCKIETIQGDIFDHQFDSSFDVICSHGFLSQFPPPQRTKLLHQWSRSLAPGGTVLLINRVRSDPPGMQYRFSNQQAQEFCKALEEELRQSRLVPESEIPGILARAEQYVQRLTGYALTNEELTGLFAGAGLKIDHQEIIVSAAQHKKPIGPAVPSNASHACLIASKR